MDELDDNQDPDDRQEIEGDEEIGPLLKRLRGDHSLRDVQRLTGVSSSYLSLIERGDRSPGVNLLNKLAVLYGVDPNQLLPGPIVWAAATPGTTSRWRWSGPTNMSWPTPVFRVGTRPDGPITLKTKRFIVEMYERYTGKRLLE